jgi:hypothetical protein
VPRALAAVLMTVLLACGCSACGHSARQHDEGRGTVASYHPTGAYRTALIAACEAANSGFAATGKFPVSGFDPRAPDPAQLPAVGAYVKHGSQLVMERLYDAVAAAHAPVIMAPIQQRLTDDLGKQVDIIRAQGQTAADGDAAGFTQAVAAFGQLAPLLRSDAKAIAIPECTPALER